jgi:hypothetical protein
MPISAPADGIRFIFATGELLPSLPGLSLPGRQTETTANEGCFVDGPFEATGACGLFEYAPTTSRCPHLMDHGFVAKNLERWLS